MSDARKGARGRSSRKMESGRTGQGEDMNMFNAKAQCEIGWRKADMMGLTRSRKGQRKPQRQKRS